MKIKCECPTQATQNPISIAIGYLPEEEIAREHEPNKCKGTYELKLYKRKGKKLYLCSACCLSQDILVSK